MMISSPVPSAPKPMPATAPTSTGGPAAPAVPVPPADAPGAADPKQAVVDKLMKTSATEAMGQVDERLTQLSKLTIGGATPEGVKGATHAANLLTDASMLLQHAHVEAMKELRQLEGGLHVRLMSSASGLAFLGGQIAVAGQSSKPVKLADVAANQIAETGTAMHDVAAVLTAATAPAADGPPAPAPAPAPASAAPASSSAATPHSPPAAAPNGNTGVVGPFPGAPKDAPASTAATASPKPPAVTGGGHQAIADAIAKLGADIREGTISVVDAATTAAVVDKERGAVQLVPADVLAQALTAPAAAPAAPAVTSAAPHLRGPGTGRGPNPA